MTWWHAQSFSLYDFPLILFLALLEILLSTDNAIALSLIAKRLEAKQRKKALFIGLIAAFIFRGLGLIFASTLIRFYWIQVIGGLYLIYVGLTYFLPKKQKESAPSSFWGSVLMIEFTDLFFAIDSILAAIALVQATSSAPLSKLWIVYLGGVFGLVAMRFAAHYMIKILEKFPQLEISAHLMVSVIGLKLLLSPLLEGRVDWLFWSLMALLLLVGFIKKRQIK